MYFLALMKNVAKFVASLFQFSAAAKKHTAIHDSRLTLMKMSVFFVVSVLLSVPYAWILSGPLAFLSFWQKSFILLVSLAVILPALHKPLVRLARYLLIPDK
ncbi:hypothetical protein [Methylovulum psychrotolerans]|uniref:Uncharacterized protein n=1 Tax=Methylovulum psychrotolerans TaxID=1704499 RepID=A0A2S5CIL2_9GAMM|nr:hypothetical protein [Methylovulum psychrotolerans]POZ50650.1 hypothetical protein AADEFJLK_03545 [Methylovulum psychrotolerans]